MLKPKSIKKDSLRLGVYVVGCRDLRNPQYGGTRANKQKDSLRLGVHLVGVPRFELGASRTRTSCGFLEP